MNSKLDQHFGINAQSMLLRSRRAEILASNIANVDTPNYKARDIDFQTMLKMASESGTTTERGLQTTSSQHIKMNSQTIAEFDQLYRTPTHPSLDGNTVDSDLEKSQFAENAVRYQISLNLLSKKIGGLIKTLRGE